MRAARLTGYGGKEMVKIDDGAPKPQVGSGEVLVEIHAAGVNPFDITVREGRARQMAELNFPATLGGDFAGVVSQIGEGVEDFQAGQPVYGQAGALSGQGSFAEYAPVKTSQLAAKPAALDFVAAASLPLAAVSAYQALADHIGLEEGQKILIHGGAGGIGSLAVQIARHIGAHVAATASAADTDFVKGLGADEVINYKSQNFTELIKDYDAVFDTVGGETNKKSYLVLKRGGTLVSMIAQPEEELAQQKGISYIAQFTRVTTERLDAISDLIESGSLKPLVDRTFPFEKTPEALEYLKTDSPRGKVVIKIKN